MRVGWVVVGTSMAAGASVSATPLSGVIVSRHSGDRLPPGGAAQLGAPSLPSTGLIRVRVGVSGRLGSDWPGTGVS